MINPRNRVRPPRRLPAVVAMALLLAAGATASGCSHHDSNTAGSAPAPASAAPVTAAPAQSMPGIPGMSPDDKAAADQRDNKASAPP